MYTYTYIYVYCAYYMHMERMTCALVEPLDDLEGKNARDTGGEKNSKKINKYFMRCACVRKKGDRRKNNNTRAPQNGIP